MRKTITTITVLATLILFLSCVKENDEQKENNKHLVHPPAWIQGTWIEKSQVSVGVRYSGFKFKKNDICIVSLNETACLFSPFEILSAEQRKEIGVKESISNTEYIVKWTSSSSLIVYHFKKISNTEIEWILNSELGGNSKIRYVRK